MDEVLVRNAGKALTQVLDLVPGEKFLIVTDEATATVADAFDAAARGIGVEASRFVIPEEARPLTDVPDDLAAMIPGTNIAVTCFTGRADETPFRIRLIGELASRVRRLGHGPGITESMLRGPMGVDYDEMAAAATILMDKLSQATKVRITAEGGTDIVMDITDRPFQTDTVISDGKWGNLPAGEIWCAPIEDSADGELVCDGSIGDLGQVPDKVHLMLTNGRITGAGCSDTEFLGRLQKALLIDDEARVIGELGIGLNPGARLTGNLLEDEKAGGTAHVAFGNNEDMAGGRNRSATHRDFLFRSPTFEVTYADGRVEKPIIDGKVQE